MACKRREKQEERGSERQLKGGQIRGGGKTEEERAFSIARELFCHLERRYFREVMGRKEERGEKEKKSKREEEIRKEIRGSLRGHLIHSVSRTEEGCKIQGAEVG